MRKEVQLNHFATLFSSSLDSPFCVGKLFLAFQAICRNSVLRAPLHTTWWRLFSWSWSNCDRQNVQSRVNGNNEQKQVYSFMDIPSLMNFHIAGFCMRSGSYSRVRMLFGSICFVPPPGAVTDSDGSVLSSKDPRPFGANRAGGSTGSFTFACP